MQELRAAQAYLKGIREDIGRQTTVRNSAGRRVVEAQRAVDNIRSQQSGTASATPQPKTRHSPSPLWCRACLFLPSSIMSQEADFRVEFTYLWESCINWNKQYLVQLEAIGSKCCNSELSTAFQSRTGIYCPYFKNTVWHAGNATRMFAPQNQGQMLARLLSMIEADRSRFQKPPLGPFGSLLSLTDDKWAVAIEASVGRTFNNFIVHSHRDAATLRVGQNSGIVWPRVHDTINQSAQVAGWCRCKIGKIAVAITMLIAPRVSHSSSAWPFLQQDLLASSHPQGS